MRTSALLIVLAGCSFPTRTPFGCDGVALPDEVTAPIHVHGTVGDPFTSMFISGADVTSVAIPMGLAPFPRGRGTTNSTGSFQWNEPAMQGPFPLYIQSKVAGYLDTFFYTALPVASDLYVELQQFTRDELDNNLAGAVGLPLDAPLIVSVVDCNDSAVGGATVMVTQGSNENIKVFYFNKQGVPDPTLLQTDPNTGAALVTGLVAPTTGEPSAPVHVNATFEAIHYMLHDVNVRSGTMTFTEVSP